MFARETFQTGTRAAWARSGGMTLALVSRDNADAASPSFVATGPVPDVTILLTASEAYPVLENLFLDATEQIVGSFLVFDPKTRLRSDQACAVGATWLDLVAQTMKRGVAIDLTISDVDPVANPDDHRAALRSVRQSCIAGEVVGRVHGCRCGRRCIRRGRVKCRTCCCGR